MSLLFWHWTSIQRLRIQYSVNIQKSTRIHLMNGESQCVLSQRLNCGIPGATWQFWKSIHMRHKTWWYGPKHGDTGYQSDFVQYQNIRMWHDVFKRIGKTQWSYHDAGQGRALCEGPSKQPDFLAGWPKHAYTKFDQVFSVVAIHIVLIPTFLSSIHGAEFWQKKSWLP